MALARRPAEERDGTGAEPQRGRSLWDDAWTRLKANRAAVASAALLVLMLLACVVGPWLSPHPFDAVYRSYVKAPASLTPYPRAEEIGPGLESALRRARVSVADWREEGGRVFVTVTSGRAIDPRTTRYLDRANAFSDTRVEAASEDGKRMVLSASGHIAGVVNPPAKKKYCYWTNGELPADPERWLDGAERHEGSWWGDWAAWNAKHSGSLIKARVPGKGKGVKLKPIEDAPGSYVKVRSDA